MRGLLIYDFTFARHRERLMMEVWRFRIGGVIVVRCGWGRWSFGAQSERVPPTLWQEQQDLSEGTLKERTAASVGEFVYWFQNSICRIKMRCANTALETRSKWSKRPNALSAAEAVTVPQAWER